MSNDAIVILKDDHKQVRKVFRDFQSAGAGAAVRKGKLVDTMIELLTQHTYIENEVMYPRVRALLPDLEDDVLESYEEHHVADVLVTELAHRERHPPHRGGGAGLVPEGARRPRPQAAPGDRRGDARREEEGAQAAVSAQRAEEDDRRGHRLT